MQAKRPLTLLLGAAGASVGAGYLYAGEEPTPLALPPPVLSVSSSEQRADGRTTRRRRSLKAMSKKELGLEQSVAREMACWISSATVYAARQAFYASSPPEKSVLQVPAPVIAPAKKSDDDDVDMMRNDDKQQRRFFGWLQDLSPTTQWDANQVIQSSSFTMLLHLISGVGGLTLRDDVEQEIYRVVGLLATNAQCASAIAERATRYGKHALLNLAQLHDDDPRVGQALHRLVVLDGTKDCHFGPANLVSLLSLAVAEELPDEYMEFALWALSKAASPSSVAASYEWRKTFFGDDGVGKTRRKLVASDQLWRVLVDSCQNRPDMIQLQAARLISELSHEPRVVDALKRHGSSIKMLHQWMNSDSVPLVGAALEIVANVAQADEEIRSQLRSMGALDEIRARLVANNDCRLTAKLLRALHGLASPTGTVTMTEEFALDLHSLSFLNDSEDDDYLLQFEDMIAPQKHQYVDGWIELLTSFLKSEDREVQHEAALCLEQLTMHGKHRDQSLQEWLVAILDETLQTVPLEIARASTSVREAKSRTRPLVGLEALRDQYEAGHARALRALAFVLDREECQHRFVRLGGVPLLKTLMQSENTLVQRETARVLANLFTCTDMNPQLTAFALQDEEMTRILAQWSRSDDSKLRSVAHRATSNRRYQCARATKSFRSTSLDPPEGEVQSGDDVQYQDGVHPLHFSRSVEGADTTKTGDYDVDVVFVHGLLGCPYETWLGGDDQQQRDTNVWAQDWLVDDLKRSGRNARVLSIGYDSQLLASESTWRIMGFESTSQDILAKLQAARVGAGDRPVIFVTHSLGGVLLKQVLLDATKVSSKTSGSVESTAKSANLVDQVQGVVFYGVPHHGSPVAQVIQSFRPRSLGIEQHPVTEHLHGTPHLKMLNDWCAQLFEDKGIAALSIGETLPCRLPVIGMEALVVPPESANPGFGEFVSLAGSTHVDVCKPRSKEDERYTLAHQFIVRHSSIPAERTSMASMDVE